MSVTPAGLFLVCGISRNPNSTRGCQSVSRSVLTTMRSSPSHLDSSIHAGDEWRVVELEALSNQHCRDCAVGQTHYAESGVTGLITIDFEQVAFVDHADSGGWLTQLQDLRALHAGGDLLEI